MVGHRCINYNPRRAEDLCESQSSIAEKWPLVSMFIVFSGELLSQLTTGSPMLDNQHLCLNQ